MADHSKETAEDVGASEQGVDVGEPSFLEKTVAELQVRERAREAVLEEKGERARKYFEDLEGEVIERLDLMDLLVGDRLIILSESSITILKVQGVEITGEYKHQAWGPQSIGNLIKVLELKDDETPREQFILPLGELSESQPNIHFFHGGFTEDMVKMKRGKNVRF